VIMAKQTTAQAIAASTNVLVTFDTAIINTDNMWNVAASNVLTVQHAGIYFILGEARWPATSGATLNNYLALDLLVNGTAAGTNSISCQMLPMINVITGQQVVGMANLAAGATIYLNVSHNAVGSITLQTDRGSSFLGAVFLTPSS